MHWEVVVLLSNFTAGLGFRKAVYIYLTTQLKLIMNGNTSIVYLVNCYDTSSLTSR